MNLSVKKSIRLTWGLESSDFEFIGASSDGAAWTYFVLK